MQYYEKIDIEGQEKLKNLIDTDIDVCKSLLNNKVFKILIDNYVNKVQFYTEELKKYKLN